MVAALPSFGSAASPADSMPASIEEIAQASVQRLNGVVLLVALLVFMLITLWSVVIYQRQRDVAQVEAQAKTELSNMARAFAEHTTKMVQGADQAIRFVRRELRSRGAQLKLSEYIDNGDVIGDDYRQLAVIGADGFLIDSSLPFKRIDLSDREHFRVHQQGAADRLFISKPVLGRVSQRWSLQLTRRINQADGRFGGVVVVSLAPEQLTRFYDDVDLGPQGVIALVGYDGVVRVRQAGASSAVSQDVSSSAAFTAARVQKVGTLWSVSAVDGQDRLYAFRALDDLGLVVMVGRGRSDILRGVDRLGHLYIALATLVSLALFGFTAALLRRIKRQAVLVEALRQSNLRANEASAMKSRFLASVSHELRKPLNGILGYAELVLDSEPSAEVQEYAQTIQASGQHLHRLVNTILDLAKIESGQLMPNFTEVDLNQLLLEACELHRDSAKSQSLSLELSAGCLPRLRTDRSRLLQVLGNLIDNAIKFTDHGGVLVRASSDEDSVTIVVSDSGVGIEAGQLESVFTRFHSLSQEFTHPRQGAGLGLPLAKELTELIGASLEIASRPGQGTEVSLRLPRRPAEAETKENT